MADTELQPAADPGGMSPGQNIDVADKEAQIIPAQDEDEDEEEKDVAPKEEEEKSVAPVEEQKVLGCIPQIIQGDCGCCSYYINPTVMTLAILIIWGFVIWAAVAKEDASEKIGELQSWAVESFGWLYIASLIFFGVSSLYFMCSSFGDIKLGPEDEEPKYPLMTWFSMLFSAGLGVGLYFFGVYEPVYHLDTMQKGQSRWYDADANQQAADAMNITWFHWGFTASACYCAAALPLAYHHHVLGEPLRESYCLMSLIGEKYATGILGCLIDLTSVIGTMFGVATSLGFGALSITAGLKYIIGMDDNLTNQLIIMFVITAFATLSVLTGLDYGIRRLSEVNFFFSFINLFFMFFILDPFYCINVFIQQTGYHFHWLVELTFNTQAYEQAGFYDESEADPATVTWMTGWTVFYWAWWIAWAPFVGIFIAQISRGRTIREFIIGNMLVPTLLTCVWFSVYGAIGLYNELGSIQNGIECTDDDLFSEFGGHKIVKLSCYGSGDMLFAAYDTLPLAKLISVLSVIAMFMYFVTSSDSASYVIDILTAGGNTEPPKVQRAFWAISEGVVAAILLSAGDGGSDSLRALQTASLVAALPFCIVLIFEVLATYKTLCIHMGYLKMDEMVYWKHDLWSLWNRFPQVIFALICPPYYQMRTRLKIVADQSKNHKHFEDNYWKYIWIFGYWAFWFCTILFLFLDFAADGFFELGLGMYLFYIGICCLNRGNIKIYYEINSSHVIFDFCSWIVCWCCAAVQEDLQSDNEGVDLEIKESLEMQEKVKGTTLEPDGDQENEAEKESLVTSTKNRG